jgi:hypothetical protein
MKTKIILILSAAAMIFTSCTTNGMFASMSQTNVTLAEPNYEITAANIKGEASAGYLIGISYAMGPTAGTLALVRIQGDGLLYDKAIENLWENYKAKHGSIEGKKLALTNVRYDTDMINLLLYTKATVSIRADVVEFK